MARPRTHTSNEDRQRAYRARKKVREELLANMDDLAQTIMQHCTPAQRADLMARLTADQQDAATTLQDDLTRQHKAYEALHHAYTVLHQDHAVLQAHYADLQNTHANVVRESIALHDTIARYDLWLHRLTAAQQRLRNTSTLSLWTIAHDLHLHPHWLASKETLINAIVTKLLPEPWLGKLTSMDRLCQPRMSEADLEHLLNGEFIRESSEIPTTMHDHP